ncbi:MAG: NADH-quinone oxidoreductase subunit J [Rhodopirellula sp.]|nr:NADH-quinone oxidoreductase subunit J [Rhodopirellula sp.]
METAAINWHSFFFLLFALVACTFAVAMLLSSNIVRMAFYLVISLGAVSGLFFLAGADFVGALQLMIYVGGTVVVLIFGVMLTARAPFLRMRTGVAQWALAAIVGGCLLAVLLQAALSVDEWAPPSMVGENPPVSNTYTAAPLGLGVLGVRVDQLDEEDATLRNGMSGYLLPFEIVSIHLLVVLIGAAYLARTKRRPKEPTGDRQETVEPMISSGK